MAVFGFPAHGEERLSVAKARLEPKPSFETRLRLRSAVPQDERY